MTNFKLLICFALSLAVSCLAPLQSVKAQDTFSVEEEESIKRALDSAIKESRNSKASKKTVSVKNAEKANSKSSSAKKKSLTAKKSKTSKAKKKRVAPREVQANVPQAMPDKFFEKSRTPLSDFELGRYTYCGQDSDCVVATNGCCDCVNGAKDVAVNRERLEDFKNRFSCLDVPCRNIDKEQRCGRGVVSCLEHKCKFFSDSELSDKF